MLQATPSKPLTNVLPLKSRITERAPEEKEPTTMNHNFLRPLLIVLAALLTGRQACVKYFTGQLIWFIISN
jgi:hypothetical protein